MALAREGFLGVGTRAGKISVLSSLSRAGIGGVRARDESPSSVAIVAQMLSFVEAHRRQQQVAQAIPPHQNIPEPLREWFGRVQCRIPVPARPRSPERLLQGFVQGEASSGADLHDLSVLELREVWPVLAVERAELLQAISSTPATVPGTRPVGPDRDAAPEPAAQPDTDAFRAAVIILVHARSHCTAPPSDAFAKAITVICASGAYVGEVSAALGSATPLVRANWLAQATARSRGMTLHGRVLLQEMQNWRQSAPQYASAIRLWGKLARIIGQPEWPPTERVLEALTFAVQRATTLSRYCSHIRSCLRLVHAPLGALTDTSALTQGAAKNPLREPRFKASASAKQTQDLADFARNNLSNSELADSWVVARHFTLRYGCEVLALQCSPAHSEVQVRVHADVAEATIILHKRKMHCKTVHVVRKCICNGPLSILCGVCVLRRRGVGPGRIFPNLDYISALTALKTAALKLNLPRALKWGTHCFRRGWADEALRRGGVPALFYSGGWRGLAAFGYATARSKGALLAANWAAHFSDSSDGEQAAEDNV